MEILPQVQRSDSVQQASIYRQPLVGELVVTFAPTEGPPLTTAQVEDGTALLERARATLERRLTSLTGQKVSGLKFGLETDQTVFTSLKVGGGLESSLLLLPHVWDQLAQELSGDLVVGVPGQDRVVFTSSDHYEGQLAMRKLLEAAFEHAGTRALSTDLFVWRGGAWEVFLEDL